LIVLAEGEWLEDFVVNLQRLVVQVFAVSKENDEDVQTE